MAEAGIVLYHCHNSTCSQKVRLVFAEKGLPFTSRVMDWRRAENLADWYLRINPNGVVPSITHDGHAVTDSSVICEYLDEVFPEPPLAPPSALGRGRMRAWMRYCEEVPTTAIRVPSYNALFARELKAMPDADFQAYAERQPLRKHFYRELGATGFDRAKYDESIDRLSSCFRRIEGELAGSGPFLLGDQYTIADIVFVPTMVRSEDLGLAALWEKLPEVSAWYARIQTRPSFAQTFYPEARVNPAAHDFKMEV